MFETNTHDSRAEEASIDRSLPEYEGEGPQQGHRKASEEGHCKGEKEHARRTARNLKLPAAYSYITFSLSISRYPIRRRGETGNSCTEHANSSSSEDQQFVDLSLVDSTQLFLNTRRTMF